MNSPACVNFSFSARALLFPFPCHIVVLFSLRHHLLPPQYTPRVWKAAIYIYVPAWKHIIRAQRLLRKSTSMETSGERSTPVVIVGGGPVGLVLARYLDFYNVKCTLINTGAETRMHPKGNGQNARTMEHYRQLGFSDEVRQLGLSNDHPFDQGFFTRFSSHEIFRAPAPSRSERAEMRKEMPVNDQYPEPMFHVNQMYVEKFLDFHLTFTIRTLRSRGKRSLHTSLPTRRNFECTMYKSMIQLENLGRMSI